jgi:hypothetical protein
MQRTARKNQKKKLKREMTKAKKIKKKEEGHQPNFPALQLLHDPQSM